MRVEKGEQTVSHDVVNLFTKTPVDPTLKIVRKRLEADKTLKKRTQLTVDNIMELLTFCTKNTYFKFNGKIYKQTEGFAMGDPLSALMSNMFMEDLEEKAISTAPVECGLKLWKRYVDDILNQINSGTTQTLTDHLNKQDPTGNIKFTNEEMQDLCLPYLDVKVIVNDDGTIRLQIYRKPTHTDQYLMFDSHHPLEHKLSVVRTLLNRKEEIVTDESDKLEEDKHIKTVLKACKYPDWAIKRVEKQLSDKKQGIAKPKPDRKNDQQHRGQVVLPYISGITERIRRSMQKRGIQCPARAHQTIRKMMVHPKDKIEDMDKCGVVYHISCKSCPQVYIGETGRKLAIREKDHKTETEKVTAKRKTRSTSKAEDTSTFQSAISEHCREKNHIMDWESTKVIGREDNKYRRWIKESIAVRKLKVGVAMNRDKGGYELSHVWDPLLRPTPAPPERRRHHQCS